MASWRVVSARGATQVRNSTRVSRYFPLPPGRLNVLWISSACVIRYRSLRRGLATFRSSSQSPRLLVGLVVEAEPPGLLRGPRPQRLGRAGAFLRAVPRNLGGEDFPRLDVVVLDLDHGGPAEPSRVLDRVQLRRTGAVEDRVEPIVSLEPPGRLVFVRGQGDLA